MLRLAFDFQDLAIEDSGALPQPFMHRGSDKKTSLSQAWGRGCIHPRLAPSHPPF